MKRPKFSFKIFLFAVLLGISRQMYAAENDNALATAQAGDLPPGTQSEKFSLAGSLQNSEHYQGSYSEFTSDTKLLNEDHFILGAHRTSRDFFGGPGLVDSGGTLGYTKVFHESRAYWENLLSLNPDAKFTPLSSFSSTPHFVLGNSDIGFGVSGSHYVNLNALTLHPSYLYEFSSVSIGGSLFITRADTTLFAYDFYSILRFTELQSLRVDLSFGRTIEDQGIETDFYSVGVDYRYQLTQWLKLCPTIAFFRGAIRSENSYGMRLEYIAW